MNFSLEVRLLGSSTIQLVIYSIDDKKKNSLRRQERVMWERFPGNRLHTITQAR